MSANVIAREYAAPFPQRVTAGVGLVVVLVESPSERLVLLADTPWNEGASMTNAASAVIRLVIQDLLAPRDIDWRSVNWVEKDSEESFDVAIVGGPPTFQINWRPLVATSDHAVLRRSEAAFIAGFGAAALMALASLNAIRRQHRSRPT